MAQNSEEIKTVEQWRWSEMQGLELMSSSAPVSNSHESNPTLEEERVMEEASSVEKKEGVPNGTRDGGGEKKKGETVASVWFGELFRFADGLDYILMAIGTVGAFVHGCSLPLFLRFFADLVNSFGSNANDLDKMTQEVVKVMMLLSLQ